MSFHSLTFAEAIPAIKMVLKEKLPVLIRGPHGIGKSAVVYQTAAELGLKVVERRASQMTEGDLLGMPSATPEIVGDFQATKFNPPAWFLECCIEPRLLFLDEVDRATREVRQGLFELNDSRKLAGYSLHEDTVVVAAVNGGASGHQYQVNDMDPAELDRYAVYDVKADFTLWKIWAMTVGINPLIVGFVESNQPYFTHLGDLQPNETYPSPRSWERLSKILGHNTKKAELEPIRGTILTLTSGLVGLPAAGAFMKYLDSQKADISLKDAMNSVVKFEEYLNSLKTSDRFIKAASIIQDLEHQPWLEEYIDEKKKNKEGFIEASTFFLALEKLMTENKDLYIMFLASMLRGIQKNVLETLNNSSLTKEKKEEKFETILLRLKLMFSKGMTPVQWKDKKTVRETVYSKEHPICQQLVAMIENNPEIVDKMNDTK